MLKWNYSLKDLFYQKGMFIVPVNNKFEIKAVKKRIKEENIIPLNNKMDDYNLEFYSSGYITIYFIDGKLRASWEFYPGAIIIPFEQLTTFSAKQIEICYTRKNNKILITNIKNIEGELPSYIENKVKQTLHLYKMNKGFKIYNKEELITEAQPGWEIGPDDFALIVSLSKKAGKTFSKAIREYNAITLSPVFPKCIKI